MCQKKFFQVQVDLLLVEEEERRHYVLIKDFNTFMYDHTLHRGRKHFCRYSLQAFSADEILKRSVSGCLKINCKQIINMPRKWNKMIVYDFSRFWKYSSTRR